MWDNEFICLMWNLLDCHQLDNLSEPLKISFNLEELFNQYFAGVLKAAGNSRFQSQRAQLDKKLFEIDIVNGLDDLEKKNSFQIKIAET